MNNVQATIWVIHNYSYNIFKILFKNDYSFNKVSRETLKNTRFCKGKITQPVKRFTFPVSYVK